MLIHAVMSRDPERVRLLMAAGADPDDRNDSGTRAADIARDHPLILRILAGESAGCRGPRYRLGYMRLQPGKWRRWRYDRDRFGSISFDAPLSCG